MIELYVSHSIFKALEKAGRDLLLREDTNTHYQNTNARTQKRKKQLKFKTVVRELDQFFIFIFCSKDT